MACGLLGFVTATQAAYWNLFLPGTLSTNCGPIEDPRGGYILAADSSDGAIVVMKITPDGLLAWQRAFRSTENLRGGYIHPVPEGGFVLVFTSFFTQEKHYHSQVARLDAQGNVIWNREILGHENYLKKVLPTRDGGFIAFGSSNDNGLVTKLNGDGDIVWMKRFGGVPDAVIWDLIETEDGAYLCAGAQYTHVSPVKSWIAKLDHRGRVLWQKGYGMEGNTFTDIRKADGDQYVAVGYTYLPALPEKSVALIVKIDDSGDPIWQRAYGGNNYLGSLVVGTDGSLLAIGSRERSNGATVGWIMKLDGSGDEIWQYDCGNVVIWRGEPTSDDGYVIDGTTIDGHQSLSAKIGSDGHSGPCLNFSPGTSTITSPDLASWVSTARSRETNNYSVSRPLAVSPSSFSISSSCRSKSVEVISPDGGEIFPSGATRRLSWETFGDTSTVDLALVCRDREQPIAEGLSGGFLDYTFPVPPDNLRNCRIRATARDAAGAVLDTDASDGHFPVEVVRLLSPVEGQILNSGEVCPVSWLVNATSAPVARTDFYLSVNAGRTWEPVGSSSRPARGSFIIPNVDRPRGRCLLRVVLLDEEGTVIGQDPSDGFFVINP